MSRFVITLICIFSMHSAFSAPLIEFYQSGIQNNLLIKKAHQVYDAQRMQQKKAYSLWLPKIQGSAGWSETAYTFNNSILYNSTIVSGSIDNKFNVKRRADLEYIQLKQRLFDISSLRRLQLSGKEKLISMLTLQYAMENFLSKLVDLYLDAVSAKDSIVAAKSVKTSSYYALKVAKIDYNLDLSTKEKYFEAAAKYQDALSDLLEANQKHTEAMAYLNQFAHTSYKDVDSLKNDVHFHLPQPQKKEAWENKALTGNTGLKINALKLRAKRIEYRYASSKYLPVGGVEADIFNGRDIFPSPATYSLVGLGDRLKYNGKSIIFGVKLPMFEGGAISLGVRKIAYEIQGILLQNKNDMELMKLQVSMAYNNLILFLQEIKQTKAQVRATKEVVRIRRTLLKYQKGTYFDYLASLSNYKTSLDKYSRAKRRYLKNLVKLHKLTGTLTPEVISNINILFK